MIILGIDPGFAIVGAGIIEYHQNKFKTLKYDKITTSKDQPHPERLKVIYHSIIALIDEFSPDCMAVEQLFFNTNVTTAISVGEGRGVVLLAAANSNIPVYEYTPLQVKQAVVGFGRAEKSQVQQMVKVILNLEAIPKPDDVADALAVAICHAHSHNINSLLRR